MSNLQDIKEQRENLYQELKDNLEITSAEDFKYWETITDFKAIIDEFERLRDQELDIIGDKIRNK